MGNLVHPEVVRGHALRDVCQRKVGDRPKAAWVLDRAIQRDRRPHHVPLRDDHGFRAAGRPRRVDERGRVLGLDLASGGLEHIPTAIGSEGLAPSLHDLVPGDHPVVLLELLRILHQDHVLQRGKFGLDLLPSLHDVAVLEDGHLGVAVRRDVLDLLGSQRVVEGDRRRAGVDHAHVRDDVLRPVADHQADEVTLPRPQGLQAEGDGSRPFPVLAPCERAPAPAFLPRQGRVVPVGLGVAGEGVADRLALGFGVDRSPFRHNVPARGGHALSPLFLDVISTESSRMR